MGIRVEFVLVAHFPGPRGGSFVVGHGFDGVGVLGLLRVKGVAVEVLLGADLAWAAGSVDLEDGVAGAVDVGVDAETEQVLVVVRVDAGVHFCPPSLGVLAGEHGVGVQDTRELDLELDGAILVEDPVHAVLVVGGREDVADDQLAGPRDDGGLEAVTEVAVLEQDTRVFLVDADGVLDGHGRAGPVDELGVHVVDAALAVTAQAEWVGHVTTAVLAEIEGVLALMRVFWVAVRDDHFRERQSVKDGACFALDLVKVGDVVEDDALSVVESDVDGPVLPLDDSAVDGEADAFGLGNVDGLQVGPVTTHLFDGLDMVVVGRSLADGSANFGDVDVDDLFLVRVINRAEVERIRVLRVVNMRSVVHECLLKSDAVAKSFIIADCPRVAVDLVHVLGWNSKNTTLLDDSRILAHNLFDSVQILCRDQGLDIRRMLPLENFLVVEVDMAVVDLAIRCNDHNIGNAEWFRSTLWIRQPLQHLSLGWLKQGDGIVV